MSHFRILLVVAAASALALCSGCKDKSGSNSANAASSSAQKHLPVPGHLTEASAKIRALLPDEVVGYKPDTAVPPTEVAVHGMVSVTAGSVGDSRAKTFSINITYDKVKGMTAEKKRDLVAGANGKKTTIKGYPATETTKDGSSTISVFPGHCSIHLGGSDMEALKQVADKLDLAAAAKL